MTTATRERRLIARHVSFGTRERVYRTPDALEIDETDHYQLSRRRVFFEEVVLVTLHRALGVGSLVVIGLLGLVFTGITMATWLASAQAGMIVFALSALPLWIAFALRIAFGSHTVTVYGRRTRARLDFGMRRERAREVYGSLCQDVRRRQEALLREQRARASSA